MDLRLNSRDAGGITIVEVEGEVELLSAPQLRGELLRAYDGFDGASTPCIVVDLSRVSFIDSSGIGVLVGALKRVRERNGSFLLVCPNPRVRRIFEITGLLRALPLVNTLDEALQQCWDSAPQTSQMSEPQEEQNA